MDAELVPLYRSANGDSWFLGQDVETSERYVLHRANAPSGGTVTRVELADFLALNQGAPEHQALTRLIDTPIEDVA